MHLLHQVQNCIDAARVHGRHAREVQYDETDFLILEIRARFVHCASDRTEEEVSTEPRDSDAMAEGPQEVDLLLVALDGGVHRGERAAANGPGDARILHGEVDQSQEEAEEDAHGDVEPDSDSRGDEDVPFLLSNSVPGLDEPLDDEVQSQLDDGSGEEKAGNVLDDHPG